MNQSRSCANDSGSAPVRSTGTTAGSIGSSARRISSTRPASSATVGPSNSARSGSSTPNTARMRETTRVASSECPPSSKKLSSTPTRSSRSTSAQIPASTSSTGVRGATYRVRRRRVLRRRQRLAVQLPVRRQRQRLQHHERRRHHVLRQALSHVRAQRGGVHRIRTIRHHVRHQPPVPRRVLAHQRPRHSRTAGCSAQRAPRSRPARSRKPADLHLVVVAAQELDGPVRAPPRQVARAVHPRTRLAAERVRHEPLRGQLRPPQVAARHTGAADVQLARHAHGHRLPARVEDVDPRVGDRPPDGGRAAAPDPAARVRGRLDGRLGGTVQVAPPAPRRAASAASTSEAGSGSPPQKHDPARQRRRPAGSAPSTACRSVGTNCAMVTPPSAITRPMRARRPSRRRGGAGASVRRAASVVHSSHTEASNEIDVRCSTVSSAPMPKAADLPRGVADQAPVLAPARPSAGPWSRRCR